ncbi:hypothetical protein Tco_0608306 [Tanacetum coccineum]
MILNECLIYDSIVKDICSIVLAYVNVVPPISDCMCAELRSSCDREHNKVLELEAEISKQKRLITESEKRFAFLEQNYVSLQLKFQNYKQCSDTSSASNAIFEINKLRDQLQGKDATIRNLQTQINITRMLNVGSTVGSFDKQALETELSQLKDALTSVRIQLDSYKNSNSYLRDILGDILGKDIYRLTKANQILYQGPTSGIRANRGILSKKNHKEPQTNTLLQIFTKCLNLLIDSLFTEHLSDDRSSNHEEHQTLEMEHYLSTLNNEVWKVIQMKLPRREFQLERMDDAKESGKPIRTSIWVVMQNSKKMQKAVFKQQFEAFKISNSNKSITTKVKSGFTGVYILALLYFSTIFPEKEVLAGFADEDKSIMQQSTQTQPSSSTLPVPSTSSPPVQSPPPIPASIPTPTPIPETEPAPFEHTFEEPSPGRKSRLSSNSLVQGLVTPSTTKVDASGEEQVEDISPNTLEAAKTLSRVASLKPKSIDKGRNKEEMRPRNKVVQSLVFQEEVDTVSTGSAKRSIPSPDKRPKAKKAPMISEETPKKSKEQILQEEASLAEAIRLDTLQKEEVAKQVHLDSLLAQRIANEEELNEQQKKRRAQVQFEAQHYIDEDWDLIRAKIKANAELSKSMLGSDLTSRRFLPKKDVDLVNQRKKYTLQRKRSRAENAK